VPQFDVHQNANPSSNDDIPFLLDVQSDLLDGLTTRVVIPLVRASAFGKPARRLNPVFDVLGQPVVLSTAELAGVHTRHLGPKVESLASERSTIVAALDVLISGI